MNNFSRLDTLKYSHAIDDLVCEDYMNRNVIAQSIASQVLSCSVDSRPQVMGIYGSWGAGKSFILSQTINLLLNANWDKRMRQRLFKLNDHADHSELMGRRCVVATFEAWRYEMEGDLAPGLIQSLVQVDTKFQVVESEMAQLQKYNPRFTKNEFKSIGLALRDVLFELAPSMVPGGKDLVTILSHIGKQLTITDEKARVEREKSRPSIDQVHEKMSALVEEMLASVAKEETKEGEPLAQYRLVVVIDDLDRCSPENMVRLFEWLKNHLNVKQCVYLLALDHEAAARAVVGRYKQYLSESRDLGLIKV